MINWLISALRSASFRGKYRLLQPLAPRHGRRRVNIFGATFDLDLADLIQREMYLGVFERAEARAVARLLRPGDTFVDAGANVGFFTAVAARRVGPGGRVVAFEPSPTAAARLRSLLASNPLPQVALVEAALSDRPGSQMLYLGMDSTNHTPTLVAHPNTTSTPVTLRTLDTEAERLDITHIRCLKIDVEGYEANVLTGAARLLAAGSIEYILCEFNEHWLLQAGSSCGALDQQLRSAGLRQALMPGLAADHPNRLYRRMAN